MSRPVVDETLCFVCQENKPEYIMSRGKEDFKLCTPCMHVVESQNKIHKALVNSNSRGGDIFRMVLGAPLAPVLKIKRIQ